MKRSSDLQKISMKIGLSYVKRVYELPAYIVDNDFLLFSSFHLHKEKVLVSCFKNILMGNFKDFQIFLSDFKMDYSVNDNALGSKQTIAVLQSVNFNFQKFYLLPKSTERFTLKFDHIGQDFILPKFRKYKKVLFPGYPQLESKYVLKSPTMLPSEKLLSMTFMQYLSDHSGWTIEGNNNALLIYRRGKKIKPSDIHKFMGDAVEFGRLLAAV